MCSIDMTHIYKSNRICNFILSLTFNKKQRKHWTSAVEIHVKIEVRHLIKEIKERLRINDLINERSDKSHEKIAWHVSCLKTEQSVFRSGTI